MKKEKKKPTIQEIAKAINISASTVSRALNNHPKISQQTKEKVWMAAKRLGYKPNIPAYMDASSSKVICFMVPDLDSPFHRDMVRSIQAYFKNQGYDLYLAHTGKSLETEKRYADSLVNLQIDGAIISLFDKNSDSSHLNQLIAQKIPTVFINKTEFTPNSCIIIPDFAHGTYKAINHFISMNCKNIIVFTGDLNDPYYADIIDGYNNAMIEAGHIDYERNIISNENNERDITGFLDNLLKQSKLPDAILATNSAVAHQITDWMSANNLKVSEDILLASFGNSNSEFIKSSNISSVEFSGDEIGRIAAKKLFQQIKEEKIIDETVVIPAKFIIRKSSLRLK